MSWQTKVDWQSAKARAKLLKEIRAFFDERGVIEVDTPLLSSGTVTDVHLDAFSTRYDFLAQERASKNFYLQTSPEFAMKRLLASGYGAIYQICKAFRDEPNGRYHNPEFTILEWYRPGFNHFELMIEVSELLVATLNCLPAEQKTYQEAFIGQTGIDPLITSLTELKTYLARTDRLELWLANETDIDTLLQFIFAEDVETKIGKERPVLIYNFPASQAALAKISSEDNRVAERFECYYKGIELVNGFHELTDADTQLKRFEQDNHKRLQSGLNEMPIDNNFIEALKHGLPQCSGVALGVDRLLMLALESNDIEQVISFPITSA